MRFCYLYSKILLAILLAGAACIASASVTIWSELSFFERQTLTDLPKARRGDPEALLALFLVASGTRDLADYENALRRIKAFKRDFDENVLDEKQHWFIGEQLNRRMHDAFFLKHDTRGKAPSGYAVDQSRLAGIFETGEYNCISASLLYAVLTRMYNIPTQGVLLPSHAFIQLDVKNGKSVDVETTSPDGYDQPHDRAFYERASQSWHQSRGLTPATYEDYLNRERVDLVTLGAQNMLNQHTAPERMDRDDRFRLAEISAYINPSDPHAQGNRLAFYLQEAHKLLGTEQWQTLKKLADTVYSTVRRDDQRLAPDPERTATITELQSTFLLASAHTTDTEQVLYHVKSLLDTLPRLKADHASHLTQNILHASGVFVKNYADTVSFDGGLLTLALLEHELYQYPDWHNIVAWYYFNWTEKHWAKQDWFAVTDVLHDLLTRNPKTEHKTQAVKALTDAYANWGRHYLNLQDIVGAETVLQGCQENTSTSAKACLSLQKDITEFKRATAS